MTTTPRNGATTTMSPYALGSHTMSVLKAAADNSGQYRVRNSSSMAAESLVSHGLATVVWDEGLVRYHGNLTLTPKGHACAAKIRR